jgi:hypothetical protein
MTAQKFAQLFDAVAWVLVLRAVNRALVEREMVRRDGRPER